MDVNKIICGDCNIELNQLPENSIDLIVTSPPYYNAKKYSHYESYNDYLRFLEQTFSNCFRVLKNGRMCVVNISVIIEPRQKRSTESIRYPLPFHFVNIMEEIGYKFLEDIIWIKPDGAARNRNGGFYQHRQPVAYKPNICNEYIFVFQKKCDFLIDKIIRSVPKSIMDESLILGDYEKTNIWRINPETTSKHLAPYPISLTDRVIKYYSFKNDIILDPFIGSGTTAISAKKLGRNYLGIELLPEYCNMAIKRIYNYGING